MAQPPRILVIEDNDLSRKLVCRFLEAEKWLVHQADSPTVAFDHIEMFGDEIRLVLCDIGLPDMDGVELLRIIRRELPRVPVLAVTGLPPDPWLYEAGFNEVIQKPINMKYLVVVVRTFLEADHAKDG